MTTGVAINLQTSRHHAATEAIRPKPTAVLAAKATPLRRPSRHIMPAPHAPTHALARTGEQRATHAAQGCQTAPAPAPSAASSPRPVLPTLLVDSMARTLMAPGRRTARAQLRARRAGATHTPYSPGRQHGAAAQGPRPPKSAMAIASAASRPDVCATWYVMASRPLAAARRCGRTSRGASEYAPVFTYPPTSQQPAMYAAGRHAPRSMTVRRD